MTGEGESAEGLDAPTGEEQPSLRSAGMRGGLLLMVRGGVGTVLRLGGMLVVTRLIGPYEFGLYASALAFVLFLTNLCQMGSEVYLIRRSEEPDRATYDTTFTLLLLISVVGTGLGIAVTYIIAAFSAPPPYFSVLRVLLLSVPLNVCWAPAQARLERRLDYRRMAIMELGGDCVLYGVAAPLAALGRGAMAPTLGFIAWQGFLFVASLRLCRTVPRIAWDRCELRQLLEFGASYALTGSLTGLIGLANPLVVGHYYGPSGVGYVNVTQRILTALGFVNQAAWRLSTVAFGRLAGNLERTRRTVEETTVLQVVAFGSVLSGFGIVSAALVPPLLGKSWTTVTTYFPVLALAALVNATTLVPQSLLYAKGRNLTVAMGQLAMGLILFPTSIWLTGSLGPRGYTYAFLCCQIGSGIVVYATYQIVAYRVGYTMAWVAIFAPILFFQPVPGVFRPILFLPAALTLIVPSARRRITGLARDLLGAVRGAT